VYIKTLHQYTADHTETKHAERLKNTPIQKYFNKKTKPTTMKTEKTTQTVIPQFEPGECAVLWVGEKTSWLFG